MAMWARMRRGEDRANAQIMLLGEESVLDCPELTVLGEQVRRREMIVAVGNDGMQTVPTCRLGNLVVVDDNPAVGEAGMAAVRRCRASVQAFHQTLKGTRGDLENLANFAVNRRFRRGH